jgi:hypothetical protein
VYLVVDDCDSPLCTLAVAVRMLKIDDIALVQRTG